MKTTIAVLLLAIAAMLVPGQVEANLILNENFSSYANGNLAGQNGWNQLGASATLPIQVSSGKVVIPGAQPAADNQDVWKDNTSGVIPAPAAGTTTIYYGMDLTVQSAPTLGSGGITAPSYFAALTNGAGGTGFANERLTAQDNSANVPGTYLLGARITGQGSDPFTYGTTPLTYGTLYNVVVEADMVAPTASNDTLEIFVNGVPYLTHPMGAGGSDPTGIGSFVFSQFSSATVGNVGATIGAVRMADTLAEAIGVPEPSTLLMGSFAIAGLIPTVVRSRRTRK
jgi:hypothetical protein